jgi:hypothetical protein
VCRIVQVGRWGVDWMTRVLPEVGGIKLVGCVDEDQGALNRASASQPSRRLRLFRLARRRADKHVLVERSFTRTIAEAKQLAALGRQANCVVMVSHNYGVFSGLCEPSKRLFGNRSWGSFCTLTSIFDVGRRRAPKS